MRLRLFFQTNDRGSVRLLVALLIVSLGALAYVGMSFNGTHGTDGKAAAGSVQADKPNDGRLQTHEGRKVELFPFDPNTADSGQLLRLGLSFWQVKNILDYRASGGVYRDERDFLRVYRLTVGQYERLRPYIRIAREFRPAKDMFVAAPRYSRMRDTIRYPLKLTLGERVPLNTADTFLLKRVPGIGSAFSAAIVKYREMLGGYYSTAQLLEIDLFPKSALPYFSVDTTLCRKLDVNKLTLNELRHHPYISFFQAKTIVDHRRLHGPIRSFNDLALYRDFTPEAIEKLKHYVVFE